MKDIKEPLVENSSPEIRDGAADMTEGGKKDSEGFLKPRWMGYVYYVTLTFFICLQLLFAKFLFQRNAGLIVTHVLTYRNFITVACYTFLIRNKIRDTLVTSLKRELIPFLILRICAGTCFQICVFYSAKYLPLVYVGLC
jgi:drug/metabolite transporter (DMT)-like permease